MEHLSPDVSEGEGFQHVPMERVLRGDLELDEEIISFDRYVENEISAPHEELEKFVQKGKARPLCLNTFTVRIWQISDGLIDEECQMGKSFL